MQSQGRRLQFSGAASEEEHRRAATWLRGHPDEGLRFYGNYDRSVTDMEWLRFYPQLRRLDVDTLRGNVPDLDGLRHLSDDLEALSLVVKSGEHGERLLARCGKLTDLALGGQRQLPQALAGLSTLQKLYIEGPVRGLHPVRGLTALEDLTLRSVTVPDLSDLVPLRRLRSLDIKLGGTKDLGLLPELGPLTYLELWMIRGLDDISAIGGINTLQSLKLESLRRVETLPDFTQLTRLRTVELGNMKGLFDFSPLANAPALDHLWVWDATHLKPEAFEPLVGHPTLRTARIGLGSDRKNTAVQELLGLPDRS